MEISRQDIPGSRENPGEKMTFFDKDGKEAESRVSEEKPHYIEKLPVGGYMLRQVTTPDGCELAEDVKQTPKKAHEPRQSDKSFRADCHGKDA